MRTGSLPPQAAPLPWVHAGQVAEHLPAVLSRYALPAARIPAIDPAEDVSASGQPFEPQAGAEVPCAVGLGAVGQPFEPQVNSGFEPSLIHAYRGCVCVSEPERMPWETWSKGQWKWYHRRQRVIAQRTAQREARALKVGAA